MNRMSDISRRSLLCSAFALGVWRSSQSAATSISPKDFGAKGDGVTNDTDAFFACASYINKCGGGKITIPPGVYIVGKQVLTGSLGQGAAYEPAKILRFEKCSRPVVIDGMGATLKFANGLKIGAFSPISGESITVAMPFSDYDYRADPGIMIDCKECVSISIRNINLDGNLIEHHVGGKWAVDDGWQCYAHGIHTVSNLHVDLENVQARNFAVDAMMQVDPGLLFSNLARPVILINCRFEFNARQGLSWVGGNWLTAIDCKFNHTGRSFNRGLQATLFSPPGAGVDLEAEESIVCNGRFIRCEFVNNVGAGVLASTGPVEEVEFNDCNFVGTTAWSAWPDKPNMRFNRCRFSGALVRAHGNAQPDKASKFFKCKFDDDPSRSPSGELYGGINADRPLADLSDSQNVMFEYCQFRAQHGGTLPWSSRAIYKDCNMQQLSSAVAYPRGRYVGQNTIVGPVELQNSIIEGTLIINGVKYTGG